MIRSFLYVAATATMGTICTKFCFMGNQKYPSKKVGDFFFFLLQLAYAAHDYEIMELSL